MISMWGTAPSTLPNSCKLHPDWNAVDAAVCDCCKAARVFPGHRSRVASFMRKIPAAENTILNFPTVG